MAVAQVRQPFRNPSHCTYVRNNQIKTKPGLWLSTSRSWVWSLTQTPHIIIISIINTETLMVIYHKTLLPWSFLERGELQKKVNRLLRYLKLKYFLLYRDLKKKKKLFVCVCPQKKENVVERLRKCWPEKHLWEMDPWRAWLEKLCLGGLRMQLESREEQQSWANEGVRTAESDVLELLL